MLSTLKRMTLPATNTEAFSGFLNLVERLGNKGADYLGVLTYHRVDNASNSCELYPGLISATPKAFARQMEYVAHHCHVVSLSELLDAVRSPKSIPPRSVMITFDDAYDDFALNAWPVLKHYNLPATLFVPTGFPDCPEREFWWDRLYRALHTASRQHDLATPVGSMQLRTPRDRDQAFRRMRKVVKALPHAKGMQLVDDICDAMNASALPNRVLSWRRLRELAAEGLVLAPHTQTHPLLNRQPLSEARSEIKGSFRDLEREIGISPPVFAYPGGGSSVELSRVLREEGFALAFSTSRGVNDLRTVNRFALRRINVGKRTNWNVIRAQLLAGRMVNGCRRTAVERSSPR